MESLKLKSLIIVAIFLQLSLNTKTSVGKPTTNSQRVPTFLTDLYNKLVSGEVTLPAAGSTVHGIFANVKPSVDGAKHGANSVDLFADFVSTIPSITSATKTNLHVHIEARANLSTVPEPRPTLCKLHIHDVKTKTTITSKPMSCNNSSDHVIPLTDLANDWLKHPSRNLGVRVKISSTIANTTMMALPFINSSSHVEQPYFIIYAY